MNDDDGIVALRYDAEKLLRLPSAAFQFASNLGDVCGRVEETTRD